MVAAGVTATVAVVAVASSVRAIESWREVGFAGAGMAEWLRSVPHAFATEVVGRSRVFAGVLLAAAAAWMAMVRARGPKMLTVLFPVTIIATTVVLASPGTSFQNHLFDAFAVSVVIIGWSVAQYVRIRSLAVAALLLLSLVAARQSLKPVLAQDLRQRAVELSSERAALVRDLAADPGLVLSESPEVLALAGSRPYLLDPFMLRVLAVHRPELLRQLHGDIEDRRFSRVILMLDPDGRHGRGWYANVNFGRPVMSRILANYELADVRAGLRVYRPKARAPQPPASALD
jgi:hypothetical protein